MRCVLDRSSCCVVWTVRDRLRLSLIVCLSVTSSAPVAPSPFPSLTPQTFLPGTFFWKEIGGRFCRLEVEGRCLMNIILFRAGSRQCLMQRRTCPGLIETSVEEFSLNVPTFSTILHSSAKILFNWFKWSEEKIEVAQYWVAHQPKFPVASWAELHSMLIALLPTSAP